MLSCACLYNKNFHDNFRKTVKANQLDLVEKKLKTSFQIARSAQAAKMTSLDFGLPLTIMWTLDCFAIEEFSKLGEVFMRYMSVLIPFFADTFCLISASTRARIMREVDQQTMGVDLNDHAGSFICCLNADSPRCRTVHLYTWWAMGKIIIF